MKKKLFVLFCCSCLMLGGCAQIRNMFQKWKGSLVGLEFDIMVYDDYGRQTSSIHGKNVDVEVMEQVGESEKYDSEVLEITVDHNQMLQVGNTIIFAEEGLEPVDDFQMDEVDAADNSLNFMAINRSLNRLKNKLGMGKTIMISSSMGIPIAVYQGDSVYVEIPDDLPKMTLINVDGKSLYIHRANYLILDTDMIE